MTGEIFDALELRFMGYEALVTVGRKLFHGFEDDRKNNVVYPYTEVRIEKSDDLGTWDADIDAWELRFRYHAKDQRPTSALDWLRYMRAAFKDAGTSMNSHAFTCAGVNETGMDAPLLNDGAWTAGIRFSMTVQWRILSPSIRGN